MNLKYDNLGDFFSHHFLSARLQWRVVDRNHAGWVRVDKVGCLDNLLLRAGDVDTVVKRDTKSGCARIRSRRHLWLSSAT